MLLTCLVLFLDPKNSVPELTQSVSHSLSKINKIEVPSFQDFLKAQATKELSMENFGIIQSCIFNTAIILSHGANYCTYTSVFMFPPGQVESNLFKVLIGSNSRFALLGSHGISSRNNGTTVLMYLYGLSLIYPCPQHTHTYADTTWKYLQNRDATFDLHILEPYTELNTKKYYQ